MSAWTVHRADLDRLTAAGRYRQMRPRAGIDFSSNDYLGLAASPELRTAAAEALARGVPVGSGGSRLLQGNHAEHEALEAEAAALFGAQAAIYFSSGFSANACLLATLPQRGDLVVHDALIHASAHDGMKLGRAEVRAAPHNDMDAIDAAIMDWRNGGGRGRVWVVVESLYSMDGDRAPLGDLIALADRLDAILIVDEAHATGVFGPGGRGLAAELEGRENIITLRTCGKALGCEGALVLGDRTMIEFLVNRGRAFIFSTAPSPLMAAVCRAALGLIGDEDRRTRLAALTAHAGSLFKQQLGVAASGSPIQPIIIGEDQRTMDIAAVLQAKGLDIRGVRPPTVPAGTSRLRVSLTLNATMQDVDALTDALADLLEPAP